MVESLTIDKEFQEKIPPLTDDEYTQLESNILSEGIVLTPLIVWNGTILDGHNRYRILHEHPEIPYTIHNKQFENRFEAVAWICKNQLGRRNLSPEQKKYLIGKQYEAEKAARGRENGAKRDKLGRFHQCCQIGDTGENNRKSCEIATENGISPRSVLRAEKFAKGIDVADKVLPGIRQEVLSGKRKVNLSKIELLSTALPDEQEKLVEEILSPTKATTKTPAQPVRQIEQLSTEICIEDDMPDAESMLWDLEDAVHTMIWRCNACFEQYPELLKEKSNRKQVNAILSEATQFISKIKGEK